MKLLALLLLIGSSSAAARFGDDNPSGDWLPVADGFVWPEAVAGAPEFEVRWREFAGLPDDQREGIRGCWPEDADPEQVSIAEIDLNADGKPELLVGVPAYSGTGGPFYEILSLVDGKAYTGIGGVQGWGFRFLAKKNGWFQIEGASRGGGGHYTRYLMTFGSQGYEITRNEGHDFNRGTVTIRQSKAEPDGADRPATAPQPDGDQGAQPGPERRSR